MKLNIEKDFDVIYETILLICSYYWPATKEKEVETLEGYGLFSSKKVLDKTYPIAEAYKKNFLQHMIDSPDNRFFFGQLSEKEEDNDFLFRFILFACSNKEWITGEKPLVEKEVFHQLVTCMLEDKVEEDTSSFMEIMEQVQKSQFSPAISWNLLLILKHPLDYMERLKQVILKNLPAQKKAWEAVKEEAEHYFKECLSISSFFSNSFKNFLDVEEITVRPTLALPYGVNFFGTDNEKVSFLYQGVFINAIESERGQKSRSQETTVAILKLIGDPKKFEALRYLNEGAKYNVEIAEHLKITAATASHHMNNLLSHGLVKVEKKDGKVFYSQNKGQIKELLQEVEEILI